MAPDIFQRGDLPFPKSLPQFQKLFPDDAACAAYLERIRWDNGFVCPRCSVAGDPFRFKNKPGVLRCRACRRDVALTGGTVMERTHTPLSVWFWAAYLVASHTGGMSAVQFQRQLGLSRYETAFQILHKMRAGMVRPDADRIGNPGTKNHVEVDETWIGGVTRGQGRGTHDQTLIVAAVEVRQREPKEGAKVRRGGRYAGRLRMQVAENRTAKALIGFVENNVLPGSMIVTDGWGSYNKLTDRGYDHLPATEGGEVEIAEQYLPIVHLVFSNLKAWLQGTHHGRVDPKHLQAYLNEFTFRFNRRFYPFNTFRSLLGIGSEVNSPTYRELYDGDWHHPTVTGPDRSG